MTEEPTVLETMRDNAQKLREKISGNISKTETATWGDVLVVQREALALATEMKEISEEQSGKAKAAIKSAIGRLEVASRRVRFKGATGTDQIEQANAALMSGALSATHGLMLAVESVQVR